MDFNGFSECVDRVSEIRSDTTPLIKGIIHGIRHKMDPTHPKTVPKQPLYGPSGFQDIPGRHQNAPKTMTKKPRRLQETLRFHKTAQEATNASPRRLVITRRSHSEVYRNKCKLRKHASPALPKAQQKPKSFLRCSDLTKNWLLRCSLDTLTSSSYH